MKRVITFFAAVLVSLSAISAEIREHNTDPSKILYLGTVEEGDADMLSSYLEEHPLVTEIALYSGGGLVLEGIEMMKAIHARGLVTTIPNDFKCYSICALMWLGGSERTVEPRGELGVHQVRAPYQVAEEMGPEAYATQMMQTIAWMMYEVEQLNIETSARWWMFMLTTPASDMYIFERKELVDLEIRLTIR